MTELVTSTPFDNMAEAFLARLPAGSIPPMQVDQRTIDALESVFKSGFTLVSSPRPVEVSPRAFVNDPEPFPVPTVDATRATNIVTVVGEPGNDLGASGTEAVAVRATVAAEFVQPYGPCEPFGFVWDGRCVELTPLRHNLLIALWDMPNRRPRVRVVADVLMDLWPDDDESLENVKDLIKQTNKDLVRARVPLKVRRKSGKVWLEVLPK